MNARANRVQEVQPKPHGGIVVHDLTPSGALWQIGLGPGPAFRSAVVSFGTAPLGALRILIEQSKLPLALPLDGTLAATLAAGKQVRLDDRKHYVTTTRRLWRAVRAETTPYAIRIIFDHADEFAHLRSQFVETSDASGFLTIAYALEPIAAESVKPLVGDLNTWVRHTPTFFHSQHVLIRRTVPEKPFVYEIEQIIPYRDPRFVKSST